MIERIHFKSSSSLLKTFYNKDENKYKMMQDHIQLNWSVLKQERGKKLKKKYRVKLSSVYVQSQKK